MAAPLPLPQWVVHVHKCVGDLDQKKRAVSSSNITDILVIAANSAPSVYFP